MRGTVRRGVMSLVAALSAVGMLSPAHAANEDFQDFFTDVCAGTGAPSGDLAARCAETGEGTGDGNISTDSESSLNPSQTLSSHDASLADARSRSKETRERGERRREEDSSLDLDDDGLSYTFGPWSLLVHVRGEWFDTDRNPGGNPERGYEGDLLASEVGLDYRVSDRFVFGGILAYEELDSDFDRDLQEGAPFNPAATAGSMESENVDVTLFASYAPGDSLFVDGAVGFRSSDYTFRRNSVFQESGRGEQILVLTEGTPNGDGFWASLNLGRDIARGPWALTPSIGLLAASSEIDAYTERDLNASGLNMEIGATERDSLLAHLGFAASYAASTRGGVLVPQLRVEWNHEFDNDPVSVATAYALDASNTQFGLVGEEPDEDYFNVAFSLTSVRPNGWSTFVDAAGLIGYQDFNRYRVTLGLRKEF